MSTEQNVDRVRRAVSLDQTGFEEVRDDAAFTPLAAGLAAVVAVLGGVGAFLWGELNIDSTPDGFFVDTVILGSIFTLILLLAWVAVTYAVLTQVFRETLAPDALFRVFAAGIVPLALGFLVFIPELNFWLGTMSIALTFFLLVFGLRAAFSIGAMRAVVAVAAGFAVFAFVMSLLITVDNSFATGAFVFETSEDAVTKSYDVGDFEDFNPEDLFPEDFEPATE